jgi:hypothetical protein
MYHKNYVTGWSMVKNMEKIWNKTGHFFLIYSVAVTKAFNQTPLFKIAANIKIENYTDYNINQIVGHNR